MKISKEKRKEMISFIQSYFLKEREEDLGDLSAGLILDFFINELAPEFYNQGICDSIQYMNEKIEDMYELQKYKR
jgi:uncharacterized protein (DUF2164 family)